MYVVRWDPPCGTFVDFVKITGPLKCNQEACDGDRILWVSEARFNLRLTLLQQLCNRTRNSIVVARRVIHLKIC